ncbi:hypothetical protein HT585_20835 [Ensifer sp. HO-A22]|uniref:Uncharacterized protein n=1 Tax=Ensifer oleiphilus TaxID=2742698 RepID=A0A7Y6UPB7_9HYPH|nr:hypothetical protein [Ensifer oleiphilus]NVD41326.1 hypothetical protein [Ensifer oleiphilus]
MTDIQTPKLPPEAATANNDEALVASILKQQFDTLRPLLTDLCDQKVNLKNMKEEEYTFTFTAEEGEALVHGLVRAIDALETMSIREQSRVFVVA